jgi:hypothetical protein
MRDVDALDGRRHRNLLVAQLVGGHLKQGDLVTDRVEAFQLFIHGVEPFHDGGKHGAGGRVGTQAGDSAHGGRSTPGLRIPKLSPAGGRTVELYGLNGSGDPNQGGVAASRRRGGVASVRQRDVTGIVSN